MIKVIVNNRTSEFYTKCKTCCSTMTYNYDDVCFENVPYSFTPKRTIVCPVCGATTNAELTTKNDYKDNDFPIMPFTSPLISACCSKSDEN